MFISSTASSALRPRCGLPAACAAMPVNLYSVWMQETQVPVDTSLVLPGCQLSAASRSFHTPSRAKNAFDAPPSSPGQP